MQPVNAQLLKQFLKYGEDAMQQGDYYSATTYFQQGLEKYDNSIALKYKLAESCRAYNDYESALENYKFVAENDASKQFPLAVFWYAMMLKQTSNYEKALTQFKKYKLRNSQSNDYFLQKSLREIESCSWAINNTKGFDTVKINHLGEDVNTAFSEFNPFEDKSGKLHFSALREVNFGDIKNKFLGRIYNQDSSLGLYFSLCNDSLEESHISNGNFNKDFTSFVFTKCNSSAENHSKFVCKIFETKQTGGIWGKCEPLDSKINMPEFTATQPAFGEDENGQEVLFYVSDRIGGEGKTDIWFSKRSPQGGWETPVNIGKSVNSLDEEYTPFFDFKTHQLFFSSNWFNGFGGLDIFETHLEKNVWVTPKNVGFSINSAANDLYFTRNKSTSKSFFVSNRKGSKFLKAETCCNDIYAFETNEKLDSFPQKLAQDSNTYSKEISDSIKMDFETEKEKIWVNENLKNIQQVLPLTLYFHNDEPDCCTLKDTTSLNYVTTYQQYAQLLSVYKSSFSKDLKGDLKRKSENEILDLFAQKVDKGFYDLVQFSGQLLRILQAGSKVEVTIQGYCSPLNFSAYNIQLGKRRIVSLENYFKSYREGAFLPFLQQNKLIIQRESFGEEKAAKSVSDRLEDTKNSVYNPLAAQERKVEIISVELK